MSQVLKMASVIADLQTTLDVYEGLFFSEDTNNSALNDFRRVGHVLKKSLETRIIIGCAAIFSDPSKPKKEGSDENMSFDNLADRHKINLSDESQKLLAGIRAAIKEMGLKDYRNKHIGHFDLDVYLGKKSIEHGITINKIRVVLTKSQELINRIITDCRLLPDGHKLSFYSKIPKNQSPTELLRRLNNIS